MHGIIEIKNKKRHKIKHDATQMTEHNKSKHNVKPIKNTRRTKLK